MTEAYWEKNEKCSDCILSVPVLSENGWHYNCLLSGVKAIQCRTNFEDYKIVSDK